MEFRVLGRLGVFGFKGFWGLSFLLEGSRFMVYFFWSGAWDLGCRALSVVVGLRRERFSQSMIERYFNFEPLSHERPNTQF